VIGWPERFSMARRFRDRSAMAHTRRASPAMSRMAIRMGQRYRPRFIRFLRGLAAGAVAASSGFSVHSRSLYPNGGRPMQGLEIEAVYERGTLKLPRELPLQEGQKVRITIHPTGDSVHRLYGTVPWTGDLEEFDRWLNDPDEGQWGNRGV
jgi:predicted DNA-binding antitoxin AbrB/MazE fold protein